VLDVEFEEFFEFLELLLAEVALDEVQHQRPEVLSFHLHRILNISLLANY